jgi:sugar phosphate isomerase/epimerase
MSNMLRRDFLKAAAVAVAAPVVQRATAAPSAAPADALDRLGWRLACNCYSFNSITLYETLGRLSALGFKETVGFNWQKLDPKQPGAIFNEKMSAVQLRDTKKRLADAGVRMTSCYCSGMAKEDATRKLFEFCREIGIETIDGEPPHDAFEMVDKLCNEYKLNMAVHNHAKPSPNWMPETLLKLFEGRSARIGACCDTGHWGRSDLEPIGALRKLQGRILTFDLKDVNEKGQCVPYGTGKCNIRAILGELKRQKFHGIFGIEYDNRAPKLESDIAQCAAFFRKVAGELNSVS